MLHALNDLIISLQNVAQSETAVYEIFTQHLQSLNLHGAISMLDPGGKMLVVKALVMPAHLKKAVQALEKFLGQTVGYAYPLTTAVIDAEVLRTGRCLYLENNSDKLNQIVPQFGFLGRQALRPFSGLPAILAPILQDNAPVGVMYLASDQLTPADVPVVAAFANQLSVMLEEARLFQTLRHTEAQYRRLFETAHDAIVVADAQTLRIISANPKAAAMTGFAQEALLTMNLEALVPLTDGVTQRPLLEMIKQEQALSVESPLYRADGQVLTAQMSMTLFRLEERLLLQAYIRDITEQKRSERLQTAVYRIATIANSDINLNELYHLIHTIVGQLMDARNFYIALYDHQQELLTLPYFVDEADRYDGRPYQAGHGLTEYVIHSGLPHLIDEKTHAQLIAQNIVAEVGPRAKIWLGVPLKNNAETFGAIVVQNYHDRHVFREQEKQFLVFVSGQIAAAIERKRAEARLQAMADNLAQQVRLMDVILSTTPDFFFVYDPQGQCLYVSPPALAYLGLTLPEAIGQPWWALGIASIFDDGFEGALHDVLRTGQAVINEVRSDEEGDPRYFENSFRPVHDALGQVAAVVVTSHEFTARKQAEEALHHTQKIESLGILAGGIAHDFNNLLVAMLGQTALALTRLEPQHPARDHVAKAEKAAERASKLTQQLLAYSGRNQFTTQCLRLDNIIRENQHFLDLVIPPNVRLDLRLHDNLPLIEADPGQIQQVVMNLILNAAEAIGEQRGSIVVTTAIQTVDEQNRATWQSLKQPLKPGEYVSLQVVDDGCGMSEETIKRMFDPFFTTKFTGRGLGLAAVLGIVRAHQGGLRVSSRLQAGTTFELLFPAATAVAAMSAAAPVGAATRPALATTAVNKSTAVILVIDDELAIREAVKDILGMANMEVLLAEDGRAGVELYRRHQQNIDLVLLDWSMPGINGGETFNALFQINPQVRVLISSGYSEVETADNLDEKKPVGFLQKPYNFHQLIAEVSRYLT